MQNDSHLWISLRTASERNSVNALPPELLWRIFMINTERQEDLDKWFHVNRLDTARSCSQVCRLWRTLLLQSSSVWGRLLDIQSFEHAADEWMEAVVSRIGDAPLWIIGYVSDSTRPFILSILSSKWQNVQVLVVNDKDLFTDKILPAWSFLEREAPTLEVFKLQSKPFFDESGPRCILPFSPLFNNHAPLLRIFSTHTFQLCPPSPWLSNLHHIRFSVEHSAPFILSALKSMPLLRHLFISGNERRHISQTEDGNLEKTHLPLLETLWINQSSTQELSLLLESITLPPMHRALRTLYIPIVGEAPLNQPQDRVHRASAKWIHTYMASRPPRYLTLNHCSHYFVLQDDWRGSEGMEVNLIYDSHSHLSIKNIADSPHFAAVEKLCLLMSDSPSWRALRPLYEALRSINHLDASGQGIGALFHGMLEFSLFPCLHTLEVSDAKDDRSGEESVIPKIIRFLEYRASTAYPVSVLDLSFLNTGGVSDINKGRLGEISGLSVKFPEDG
ncbi:hypothetical protein D9613_011864 [Agrocybe pediades]|uniref:F-box domain-containing protein n=1 Tax=Agrocybe pediades TaxID=84607 RepID=A0A8H4QKN5_9AGAR|nr:hypothetical protein D9613_011864 [Agrocybe pediades]